MLEARCLQRSRAFCCASADADEGAPGGGQAGKHQDNERIVAERAPIAAHLDAERPNLVIARGIKQARQDGQYGGGEIHLVSPGLPRVTDHAAQCPAGISLKILRVLDRNIARVDMSGKSGAHRHHRKNYKPAPGKPERAFSFAPRDLQSWFQFCEFGLLNFSLRFDTSGKSAP
jgi:hypothetical protein